MKLPIKKLRKIYRFYTLVVTLIRPISINYVILKSRKLNRLNNLHKCELQARLLNIGVKDLNGTKEVLIKRIFENEKLKHRIKRNFKPASALIFVLGIILTIGIETIIRLPIEKKQQAKFAEKVLESKKKDERIRNLYRIVKSPLDIVFPYGYKIFATNPKTFLNENDTIFSNILASGLNEKVYFDYSANKVHIEVEENVVYRFNKKFVQEGNIYRGDKNIPPPGYYVLLGNIQMDDLSLYFMPLDNTRNDEIYLLGYRKLGAPIEFSNYHAQELKDF